MIETFEIPGLAGELEQVEEYLRELGRDALEREPLSGIVGTVMDQKGKRIRPLLILLTGRLGKDYLSVSDRLCRLSAVVELTHTASLIHDDIVDDSPLRRGRPTVQARFGKDMAVYAGDFLLSKILSYLMEHDMTRDGGLLARSMSDMCCGELSQYEARFDTETTEKRYFGSILGKTAALFETSCRLGALESGCSDEEVREAASFGRDFGVLYQLRDDMLDFTSNVETEGKPGNCDFIGGVYTLPVLYTFGTSAGQELRELAVRAAHGDTGEAVLMRMLELISVSGGMEYLRVVMTRYEFSAITSLHSFPDCPARRAMESLLCFLMPERADLPSLRRT